MRRWTRITAIATAAAVIPIATAVVVGAGTSLAVAGTPQAGVPAVARAGAAPPQLALVPPTYQPPSETHFVPITPCRVIDTRPGRIDAGTTRDFHIRGTTGFAEQGGTDGGCGIPDSAAGVAVSVSSVNIAGTGYFRIWPYGQSDPGATIAHYQLGPITTTGGTVTLSAPGANDDVTVKAFDAAAGLVVDVTGYYAPPLAGFISASGQPYSGSPRIINASHVSVGTYEVQFDRNIRYCSATVTSYISDYVGSVSTWFDSNRADTARIWLWTKDGAAVDQYFYINVLC